MKYYNYDLFYMSVLCLIFLPSSPIIGIFVRDCAIKNVYSHIFHMWELITYPCSSVQTLCTSEVSMYRPETDYNSHELPFIER